MILDDVSYFMRDAASKGRTRELQQLLSDWVDYPALVNEPDPQVHVFVTAK
jgi:hypothetical protein